MRLIAFVIALVACSAAVLAGDAKPGKAKKKRPPPPPGIWWEKDYAQGMARSMREGRPVFYAVNALENERANNQLAQVAYQTAAWGEATRGYVAFVCNPASHMAAGEKSCSRYPGIPCAVHQQALAWFTSRFGGDLISPQHVILEPDGDVAFRKEYYTGVVRPALLEAYLSKLAPRIAYSRAGIGRQQRIKELAKLLPEEVDAVAKAWLDGSDGLAAAAIVNVLDDSYDARQRAALIQALRHAPPLQVPVLVLAAEERVLYPADEPAETLHWIRTLFAADRKVGVWAATRALVRMEAAADRESVLRIWAGTAAGAAAPGIDDLPAGERAFAYEALILARDRRALPTRVDATWKAGREFEILRALRKVDRTTAVDVALEDVMSKDPAAGVLRTNLLRASEKRVREAASRVAQALRHSLSERVRIAAALALLRARLPQKGAVVATIVAALDDPIEGPETRAHALAILGVDPGQSRAEWRRLLAAHLKGGAK